MNNWDGFPADRRNEARQAALVALKIKKGIKAYAGAIVSVKTAGLICDKFVKIDPGGSGEILNPGGTVIDTSLPLDIDDMIGKYIFGVMTKGENEKTG